MFLIIIFGSVVTKCYVCHTMASVQIRIPKDTYDKVLVQKGRLSIGAYVASLQDEIDRLREQLKSVKKK